MPTISISSSTRLAINTEEECKMTIEEFLELLIDGDSQHINIYDNEKGEVIFDGEGCEIPDELLYAEVTSIDNVYADNNGVITLNVDAEEDYL